MKVVNRLLLGLALLAAVMPAIAPAQDPDAFVLAPGLVRLRFGGVYSGYDARFGPGGSEVGLGTAFEAPLGASAFAPLGPVQQELRRFFAATGGPVSVDESNLTLGVARASVYDNLTRVPMSVSVGVLPRLELRVALPVVRGERLVRALTFEGGTVGENPDPTSNAAAFRTIGAQWEALGGAALLPTANSPLGEQLQARAKGAGANILLPAAAADDSVFNRILADEFGVEPLESGVEDWRIGDLELGAAALLLSTFGNTPFPAGSTSFAVRSSVSTALRLPTGRAPDVVLPIPLGSDEGRSGFSVDLRNDLFVGAHFWTTVTVGYRGFGESREVRLLPSTAPFASADPVPAVRVTPGSELALRIAPRYRLAEALALGASYEMVRVGAAEGGWPAAAGTVQRAGLLARYSTLPAVWRGASGVPAEASIAWETTLGGPEGFTADSRIAAQASLYPRLWRRR